VRGTLKRIEAGEKSGVLRTDRIEGEIDALPEVGRPFAIVGAALDPAASCRVVTTSRVVAVAPLLEGYTIFHTASGSRYSLTVDAE
jgi:hypothetical protein